MSRYYNILEKHVNDQLISHGITTSWSKLQGMQHNPYANYYNPQVINERKVTESTKVKETNKSNNFQKKENISTNPSVKSDCPTNMFREEATNYSNSQPACVKVTSEAIINCANNPFPINALATGVVAKIPVVLAELTIQVNVDSIIELPQWALEIKNIKKNLKITQCILLQNTNILFIKGFVRKNIEYSTPNCSTEQGICGDICHCTIDVPFKCTTTISFNGIEPAPIVPNSSSEFEYFKRQKISKPGFSEKDELLSSDLSEFNQITTAFYNELPFCELTSSRIVEFDELLNTKRPKEINIPFEERFFKNIEEKMVINLTLKILQYRQVAIPPTNC